MEHRYEVFLFSLNEKAHFASHWHFIKFFSLIQCNCALKSKKKYMHHFHTSLLLTWSPDNTGHHFLKSKLMTGTVLLLLFGTQPTLIVLFLRYSSSLLYYFEHFLLSKRFALLHSVLHVTRVDMSCGVPVSMHFKSSSTFPCIFLRKS